jgi:DNA polymerase-3 subunit alpha
LHLVKAKFIVGQNVGFDVNIMGCEFYRMGYGFSNEFDACFRHLYRSYGFFVKIPGGRGGKFKLPTLTELHQYLFNQPFAEAHNATADVEATTRCFLELIREIFTKEELDVPLIISKDFNEQNPKEIQLIGLKHINLKEASEAIRQQFGEKENPISKETL